MAKGNMQNKCDKILSQMLKLVPFDGWNEGALSLASLNAGFSEHYEKIAFKGGIQDVITLFLKKIDSETYARINNAELKEMKIRERIFHILYTRFEVMAEYKPVIRKTAQFLAMPQNICFGTKLLWEMADNAWYAAGDNSADFNHYTKRATLMAVYSSTLLFWLEDASKNHSETYEFLKRRIQNVMKFEKFKGKMMSLAKIA